MKLTKVLIHQANEKMDHAIVQRFFKLYDYEAALDVMPMCISKLGNSSVATIPTLYDLMIKGQLPGQKLQKGDIILFASVGAGMNINAVVYKV
jgi:3-oxoacyl-[acyl-carrier-protein] synthase-3